MMKPVLSELKQKIGDKATILKIDLEKNPAIAGQLQIQGVPTIILFQNNEIKWRQSGVVSAHVLEEVIERFKV